MPTNKKIKAKKNRVEENKEKEAKDAPIKEEGMEITNPYTSSGFNASQLTAIVFICVGFTYFMEYHRTFQEGTSSPTCAKYLISNDDNEDIKCSSSDLFMVMIKRHSSIVIMMLVGSLTVLCWKDEPLLQRMNLFLGVYVAFTTMLLYRAQLIVNGGLLMNMGVMCAILFGMCVNSQFSVRKKFGPPLPITTPSFRNATLAAVTSLVLWSGITMLSDGMEGFANLTEISDASRLLLRFAAIDRICISLLTVFPMLYLEEGKQRGMLLVLCLCTTSYGMYFLPDEFDLLQNAGSIKTAINTASLLLGAACFMTSSTLKTLKMQ